MVYRILQYYSCLFPALFSTMLSIPPPLTTFCLQFLQSTILLPTLVILFMQFPLHRNLFPFICLAVSHLFFTIQLKYSAETSRSFSLCSPVYSHNSMHISLVQCLIHCMVIIDFLTCILWDTISQYTICYVMFISFPMMLVTQRNLKNGCN